MSTRTRTANFDVWHLDVNRGYRPYPLTRNKPGFSSVEVAASPRQQVAFVLWEKDGGRRLMLMNTTGRLELVPLAAEFETVANPAFSPNGELLTFFGLPAKADENATQEEAGIFLLSMQNYSEITRATPLGSNWKDASFHHNGQRLFVSDGQNISYLDVGRQYLDQVTFLGHNSAPVMSPNGRFLALDEHSKLDARREQPLRRRDVMKLASRA
ncbi:hypothetical protein M3Y99_01635900 [Aphelenchoides fujianensis]|nr:hypothetical protein M3Y99_01635900 [Aphelenchoides fujianensis]